MSKIYTKAELKSLNKRIEGSRSDKTGIFGARVKPKITELLNKWFPMKKQLEKIIKNKKGHIDIWGSLIEYWPLWAFILVIWILIIIAAVGTF